MTTVYTELRNAIQNKQQVSCIYHGLPREICPHVIGTKNGQSKVLAYQFGGRSSRGLPPDGEWRCMFVDEITNVSVANGEWYTAENHSKPQTCVDEIDLEVAY